MVYLSVVFLALFCLAGSMGCSSRSVSPMEMMGHLTEPATEPKPENFQNLTAEQRLIDELLKKNGYNGRNPTVLVVHKSSRKLTTYKGHTPLKTYPIVLGGNPRGDKMCQGDQCTPEGVYRVKAKYPHAKWTYFIWLDYPNNQNWVKYSKAKRTGHISPKADIGGAIGIHGTEDDLKNLRGENWTLGCISLVNRHVEEIYPLVDQDTLVVIVKK
jgi:murein L,D-transpeptidase YafK